MINEFSTFGSCASRGIFNSKINKNYKNHFHINYSVESSSMISLMSDPIEFDNNLIDSDNHYFNECVNNDLSKNFLIFLKKNLIDFLIIDTYFDVNKPIILFDKNQFITDTLSLNNQSFIKYLEDLPRISIENNFDEYYSLYTKSVNKFFKFVNDNCKELKVIINCARSVYKYMDDGKIIENQNFKNVFYLNKFRNILDKYILENFDVEVLPFNMNTFYDPNYLFGIGHTHYEHKYFIEKTNQLKNIIKKNLEYNRDNELFKEYRERMRENVIFKWDIEELENKINYLNKEISINQFNSQFFKFCTARIDIKNEGYSTNDVLILDNSDNDSEVTKPNWFKNESGIGTVIQSVTGKVNFKIKCINGGKLKLWLRGIDFINADKRIPIYIKYYKILINESNIIKTPVVVWHNNPYFFEKDVENNEIINISIEWGAI